MTEDEWLKSDEPNRMLQSLRERKRREDLFALVGVSESVSRRKLRLFGCAAARQLFPDLPESCRNAIETAERFADGLASSQELARAKGVALQYALSTQAWTAFGRFMNGQECFWPGWDRQRGVVAWATLTDLDLTRRNTWCGPISRWDEACFIRDIWGNTFHPVSVEEWLRTRDVVVLSRAIYDDRTFDRLPILADALEDAGCDNQAILDHCRQPGEHLRGCWVVDLILGKS